MTFSDTLAVIGLIVALIAAIGGFTSGLVPQLYNDWFSRKHQRYKFFYMKVNCLKHKKTGASFFYKKHVRRLNQDIEVFSEVQCYRLNIFGNEQKLFKFSDRSSGVIDLQVFHPLQEELVFTDERAADDPNFLSQTVEKKSRVYFSRALYLNGFQPNDEDMSMKMERETEEATLIVDFTSLPNFDSLFKKEPKGFHCSGNRKGILPVQTLSPGVYSLTMSKLKENDVLRIDFFVDWNLL